MINTRTNHQVQAVLLLTTHFGKPAPSDPRPLTPTEWGRFAQWLREHEIQPETLLLRDPAVVLKGWHDPTITLDRIRYLLDRAGALGLALEKWERAGLWVLPRSDSHYPARLKKLLKNASPPILFGCGNQRLLNNGGIAVIGSRDARADDLAFTRQLSGEAALQGYSIVSGGARGVDEAAMLGALERDGTVIGVLADSLLRAATSAKYRSALMSNNLVLVSPFNPEAGFDVGNAMSRNKYIYCLADAAIVIATSKGKGGTWNGAIENLKARWVPLWVKRDQASDSGNAALVQAGARWLPEGSVRFDQLIENTQAQPPETAPPSLFDLQAAPEPNIPTPQDEPAPHLADTADQPSVSEQPQAGLFPAGLTFYDLFLHRFKELTVHAPATVDQLSAALEIHKTQLNEWLKRAVAEGYASKYSKPTRYQWITLDVQQPSLLSDEPETAQNGTANA